MTSRRSEELVLAASRARATISPRDGGRIASVVVAGRELLVTDRSAGATEWGAFPMVPWAGRIRRGRFVFRGSEYALPITLPPHAIHGLGYNVPWRIDGEATISAELDERWPFRGRVVQSFAIDEEGFEARLSLEADEPMPAAVGWHPWFRRALADAARPAELRFSAREMLLRDTEAIPTGERVAPPAGPWDDAFTGLAAPPVLEWPGQLRLTLTSTCDWWVVYDMRDHAICVEPQSGPPDAANLSPEIVMPDAPLVHTMRWSWEALA